MTTEIEAALRGVFEQAPQGTVDERVFRALVEDLVSLGCGNLVEKLVKEGRKRRASNKLEDLAAELRMARALARHLGVTVDFDIGNAADLRFKAGSADCLVEVKHEPAPAPWSALFHPDPVDIPAMAHAREPWKRAGHRFHEVLQALPVAVEPWLGNDFLKDRHGREARDQQEGLCGEVAAWLADELPGAVNARAAELRHPIHKAMFKLKPLVESPGHVLGHASLEAWFVDEGTMRTSVKTKSKKAAERLAVTGADCYLVGIVASEALASRGTELLTNLLGPAVHRGGPGGGRSFRTVLDDHRLQYERAQALGRGRLLDLARYDVSEGRAYGEPGLFFDPDLHAVSGVLGLYYTEELQFVPNPFTSTSIENLCHLFPTDLQPFGVI